MVSKQLIDWIKSEEAQGYTEKALTLILTKQGHSKKKIQEAFNSIKNENVIEKNGDNNDSYKESGIKSLPFSVSFVLLSGICCIALNITLVALLMVSFRI